MEFALAALSLAVAAFLAVIVLAPDQVGKTMLLGIWILLALVSLWPGVQWLFLQGLGLLRAA